MAQSVKTPQEFIQYSFSPLVAVLSSPKVENILSKNNLSFTELLQPFCTLSSEGHIRDPSGTQCAVRNWKLVIRDVNWKPPPPTEARKRLNHAVSSNISENTVPLQLGNHKIDIPTSTPWFDDWRESYFEVQFPSDHEFTKHYVACMLVGTTLDGSVIDTFSSMVQQMALLQSVTPPKLPKWFNSNVLRSYVLLYDVSTGSKDKAERAFESLKQTYGAGNCFFLCINSKNNGEPNAEHVLSDPWRPFIIPRAEKNQSEMGSSRNSLPRTPVDARAVSALPSSVNSASDDDNALPTVVQQTEGPHPLSPAEEIDVFDNANSLQNDTLSGSIESISSYINTNVWDPTIGVAAVVHGSALTTQDIDNIKQFVNDFAFKALLPYFERQISQLHEAVANRKGVSRSLFSATKRWFGSNKPGTNTNANTVIYTPECPELQLRRLGDLWFMCGQWTRAYEAYHTAKREFNADGAWLCYAGALEMAALSAFMAEEPSRKTYGYMEESVVTYLTTCRMVQYAVRATLLSVQCLNSRGLYGEAAKQLIRMTSEDSDLRSAVLLEQAALCFVSGPSKKAMCRKYAFHMVLAGHRFSKAGQKKHAYRCYQQAFQVYGGSGWRLAADHVQFALGRLAGALRLADAAAHWLSAPLAPYSPQPTTQQLALLREYMLAHQQWVETSEEFRKSLPLLPLPLLVSNATAVLCGGIAPLSSPGRTPASATTLQDSDCPTTEDDVYWHKMEQMLLQVAQGAVPMIFKPTVNLHTDATDNTLNPLVPQGEPVQISIVLHNPLKIPLTIMDLELLWQFQYNQDSAEGPSEPISNETFVAADVVMDYNIIACQKLKSLTLEGDSKRNVALSLTPLQVGELQILGVAFKLCNTIEGSDDSGSGTVIVGKQIFSIRGPRLKKNKDEPNPQYGDDKRLQVKVVPSAPCLQMTFSEISTDLLCGELQRVEVEFRNVGPVELKNLHLAVSHPECLSLVMNEDKAEDFKALHDEKYLELPSNLEERLARAARWRACAFRRVTCVRSQLAGGGCTRATLLLRPAARSPRLYVLAYYENANISHRLLRHVFSFNVLDSVKVVAIPRRNIRLKSSASPATETMNLAVEIKNISKNYTTDSVTFEVLQASLLGKQWQLTEFVSAKNTNDVLCSHEKVHFVLRGNRMLDNNLQTGKIQSSGLKLNHNHMEAVADANELPYSRFVAGCTSPFEENTNASDPCKTPGNALIQSMLVIRWKAHVKGRNMNRTVIGQHYLWLDCFTDLISSHELCSDSNNIDATVVKLFRPDEAGSSLNVTGKSYSYADALMYRLEHSSRINHNFASRRLCLVPVRLHIVNCFGGALKACIDMSSKSNNASAVSWAGAVSGHSGGVSVSLKPFEAKCLNVQAVCSAPGTYMLGDTFKVTCQVESASELAVSVVQPCTITSLLIVKQTQ